MGLLTAYGVSSFYADIYRNRGCLAICGDVLTHTLPKKKYDIVIGAIPKEFSDNPYKWINQIYIEYVEYGGILAITAPDSVFSYSTELGRAFKKDFLNSNGISHPFEVGQSCITWQKN